MADIGFMEQLTGPANEEAIADAVAEKASGSQASAERGVTNLASGIASLFGRKEASANIKDRFVADANQITVEELRSRRQIRKALGNEDFGTGPEARIKMAQRAAEIARDNNDGPGLARALSSLNALRQEQAEFDKLQAEKKGQEARNIESQVKTGYNADGTPVSGVQTIQDGVAGLTIAGPNGRPVFKPFGEGFSRVDPTKKQSKLANEPVDVRIRKLVSKEERKVIKSLASSANSALERTDRVLGTLIDLFEEGGVESVIGVSGGIVSSIDNFARNVNGVINAFAGAGKSKENDTFRGTLQQRARDAGDFLSSIIQLPEGVEATSAAAQQHRANVMEMAYMAARLAEPSNRGLSDNDIKNALTRIAGGTSNPQVMVRRFLEMQVDASNELDFALRLHHGSLGPDVTDDEIDAVLGGKGIPEYRERRKALFEKYGIEVTDDNRAIFGAGTAIGTDVQPGEGTGVPGADDDKTPELSDEEFLESF
jgi:hypothetical protein